MSIHRTLLPSHVSADRIVARVGLISDTHLPARCAALPSAIFDALGDVDTVLHAGEVGALGVLDELSVIAPVIAVHGNDEGVEAQGEFPYQQIIAIAGRRVLLCHSHFPDRDQGDGVAPGRHLDTQARPTGRDSAPRRGRRPDLRPHPHSHGLSAQRRAARQSRSDRIAERVHPAANPNCRRSSALGVWQWLSCLKGSFTPSTCGYFL